MMATLPKQLINRVGRFSEDCVDSRHVDYHKIVNTDIDNTHLKDGVCLPVKADLANGAKEKSDDRFKSGNDRKSEDGSEETFKKGHARKDSGHVYVTGDRSDNEDSLSPIVSSDEEGEGKTRPIKNTLDKDGYSKNNNDASFQEKSDEEGSEKDVFVRPTKGVDRKHGYAIENSFGDDCNNLNKEQRKVYPVQYDISKLCSNLDTQGEKQCYFARTKTRNSKRHKAHKQAGTQHGVDVSNIKDLEVRLGNVNIGTECTGTYIVNFAEHIQDGFANLVQADFDAMELCDYLYQHRIMNIKTYEVFFELSHSTSNSDDRNLKRRLMLFLSKNLPRDTLEEAVTEAGCSHVFFNVFSSVGLNRS